MAHPLLAAATPALDAAQSQLLALLKDAPGFVSGEGLAASLGLSRTAVWKRVLKLKAAGYQIEGSSRRGYRLLPGPDLLLPWEIAAHLETACFRGPFLHFVTLPSTNDLGKALGRDGFPEGTVIVAETQTAGRGRLGRTWDSPPTGGLYVSLLLRPPLPPGEMPKLTLTAAVAAVQAIARATGIQVGIKWPNDLILAGRKLGGILTEMETESDQMGHIVLGMGMNVQTPGFPPELQPTAISLAEVGRFSRLDILRAWLEALDHLYETLPQGGFGPILDAWRQYSVTLGTRVTVRQGPRTITGLAREIAPDGALLVEVGGGQVEYVICGEIDQGLPHP